jgi:hypothetical protein
MEMVERMKMPKVWDVLKRFMDSCRFHGWKTSEDEDWVEANDKYHNFLWTREVHPSSFKRIASNQKCIIREGMSYHVVEASYTAWLTPEQPSETLVKTILEDPNFSSRTALYDLSPMLQGKNLCLKLNYTDSPVFQEFEHFLKQELKVKIKPFSNVNHKTEDYNIAEMA